MDKTCRYTYKTDNRHHEITPPVLLEESLEAFHTFHKSGDHKRYDIQCLEENKKGSTGWFPPIIWSSDSEGKGKELDCSQYTNALSRMYLNGENISTAFWLYDRSVQEKHFKISRNVHDKYTKNMEKVLKSFDDSARDPASLKEESSLYSCLRKNTGRPLQCVTECENYIKGVNQKASKCFRLAPSTKRKQKVCLIEFDPIRKPRDLAAERQKSLVSHFRKRMIKYDENEAKKLAEKAAKVAAVATAEST